MTRRRGRAGAALAIVMGAAAAVAPPPASAQTALPRVTPASGLVVVETLHFAGGERESVVSMQDVSPAGIRYGWRVFEVHARGDTIRERYTRFVSAADLARARRLHAYHEAAGPTERPGSTSFSLSTAVYRALASRGRDSVQVMDAGTTAGAGLAAELGVPRSAARRAPVLWRGTLTRVSAAPRPFPVLLNGRRVMLPTLHLRGQLTATRGRRWDPEIWVLADSAYPMLLRWKGDSESASNLLQVVRIDLPLEGGALPEVERALASSCRVELPGIYFASNSAELDPASDRAIAALAGMLARHGDWQATVEGHTDSRGADAANRALSQQRAAAVRDALIRRHRVDAARLRAVGHGESRPREPNATVEGRAANRRVEIERECGRVGEPGDRRGSGTESRP